MSIDISRKQEAKVREDLNMQRLLGCLARDRPSRYGGRGCVFFCSAGAVTPIPTLGMSSPQAGLTYLMQVLLHRLPCPRDCSLILSMLSILAILLQNGEGR